MEYILIIFFLSGARLKVIIGYVLILMTNSTAIEFEIETFFNKNKKIKLDIEITEEQKFEINEILKRFII